MPNPNPNPNIPQTPEAPRSTNTQADRAVWLVCRCNPARMVHSVRDRLVQFGVEHYMATHIVLQRRQSCMVEVEESYLGSYCFIRTSPREAMRLKYTLGVDLSFIRTREMHAASGSPSGLLTISDSALDDFRRVIEAKGNRVNYQADLYAVGDEVIVMRGPLVGVRGTLIRVGNSDHLMLRIPGVLAISVKIGRSFLRRIRNGQKDGAQ